MLKTTKQECYVFYNEQGNYYLINYEGKEYSLSWTEKSRKTKK